MMTSVGRGRELTWQTGERGVKIVLTPGLGLRIQHDFELSGDGRRVELLGSDIGEWRIRFVNTGLHSNVGPPRPC